MTLTAALVAAGLVVSIVSALEQRVRWIASFCSYFGDGCRQTQDFTLMRIPVAWWGIAYYAALAVVMPVNRDWIFWLVMAGLGFELTFLWILVAIRAFCIFCMFNAVVVAGLVAVTFDPARIWPGATLALVLFLGSKALLAWENELEEAPPEDKAPDAAVAVVGGDTITFEELEKPLAQQIYRLKERIYRLKRDRLASMIHDRLLQKEAERRGIAKEELVDRVAREAPPVTDEEVERHCRENQCDIQTDPEAGHKPLDAVRERLAEEKQQAAVRRFAEDLEADHDVSVWLDKPLLPQAQVPIDGRPAMGPADAPVVVVELSDPFCPACRAAHEATREVKAAFEDRVRWVFKDFPLEKHPGAKTAAMAAHCAGDQGKFWEYQDRVFAVEGHPDEAALEKLAADLDLDTGAFARCLEEERYRDQVEEDIRSARRAGVSATPTFIINGEMVSGALSAEAFKAKIEAALETAGSDKGSGEQR